MKTKDNLKILVLQFRKDKETEQEELDAFTELCGLHRSQVDGLNACEMPEFDQKIIDKYDAFIIGGSSDANVVDDVDGFFTSCETLLTHCLETDFPVYASCYGFELAVKTFGGDIIHDEAHREMGEYHVQFTEEALLDPLLQGLPKSVAVISGHEYRAARLPDGATLLASNQACPIHLAKFGPKFYGSQFHPELNDTHFVDRLTRYQVRFFGKENSARFKDIMSTVTESTEHANRIMRQFIDNIVLAPMLAQEDFMYETESLSNVLMF